MTDLIKRLQERRANVWEQAKELLDAAEKRGGAWARWPCPWSGHGS
ncbi:hypothetical protein [Streptomyces sp. adm13(2018)]|nr:hypothetical protein [Streptomyces sp. adm13(2018)]